MCSTRMYSVCLLPRKPDEAKESALPEKGWPGGWGGGGGAGCWEVGAKCRVWGLGFRV